MSKIHDPCIKNHMAYPGPYQVNYEKMQLADDWSLIQVTHKLTYAKVHLIIGRAWQSRNWNWTFFNQNQTSPFFIDIWEIYEL